MSENSANGRGSGAGERAADRMMSPRLRHIIRQRDLEDIRRSTEELTRRQQSQSDGVPSGSSSARRNRSDWRVVYGDASGTQTVLPPIEDLMSRSSSGRTRTAGYRRPDTTNTRDDRRDRLSSILPPLPDQSDEAVDIEMTNQRMDETDDDPAARYRVLGSRFGTAADLEVLLGGDDYEFEFARARHPSRLRQSATVASENPASDPPASRDVDPAERRWIESLYMQFPPGARETLSPHVRDILAQRRDADAGRPGPSARDPLWHLMLQESQTDEDEDEESDWEVSSSPGEIPLEGASRLVGDILADMIASRGTDDTASVTRHRAVPPVPSRPATNAHLRATHVPEVIGSSNRGLLGTRAAVGGSVRDDAVESHARAETAESGPGLRRRKSIKRRRIDAGMDISYPYPIMTSTASEPIPKESLPEYMQIVNTPIVSLPVSFNPLDKCVRLSISPLGSSDIAYGPLVVVKFTGTGARGDADAAAVRTDQPIPSACGIYYYEATIVSKGQEGFISIGFSNRFTNLSRLVGWEPGSFAWHMDDGFVFEGRGEGVSKGWPTSTTGDVIGCGIDFTTGQAFFTKNGQLIGHAFRNVGQEDKLYPSIGLRTPGETVHCDFKGPFKYDIVEHVRKAQRELMEQVIQKEYVAIKAPDGPHSPGSKDSSTAAPAVAAEKSGKGKAAQKPSNAPASPQKVVRNIDGALAPAVLSYLQHNGFFGSAAAMRKDMSSRKRLLETGLGEADESRMSKIAKTEKWYETQEGCWRQLQKVKIDYAENRLSSVWSDLRDGPSGPSIGFPYFLNSDDGLWACRLRIRYFYKILWESLQKGDVGNDPVKGNAISLPELFSDIDFKTFILGETELLPVVQIGSECDASSVLLAAGGYLRVQHQSSSNPVIQEAVETALSYMPYTRISDLPPDVLSHISQAGLAEEAEELVKAIREHQGKPTTSALEMAFATTDRTLVDLGRGHNVASAAFLSVQEITGTHQ